jgi:2'-5' RNA ligase
MKRLFIAIKIVPEQSLLNVYYDIKKRCHLSKIKWVDSDLFHLTLKFLGEVPERKIDEISNLVDSIVSNYVPFEFIIRGVGIFGSSYRPRVVWLGIEKNDSLTAFGNAVLDGFDKIGFKRDSQNFVPHLTVGRIKYVQDKNLLRQTVSMYKNTPLQKVMVNKIVLYESILHKTGPEYIPIMEFNLGE